jgi:RHS repeat-associated protein
VTAAASGGQVTTYAYDPAGNETSVVNPDGVTEMKTYTPLNLLATVSFSGSAPPNATYTYDADNNQISMTDASGTSTNAFDPFDEVGSIKNGAGVTTSRQYDLDGDVERVTYSLSGASWASTPTIIYQFDHADELTLVTDFNSDISRIGYSSDGLPTTLRFGGSGPTVTTTYAKNDSPASITLGNGSTLQEFAYSDAPDANIVSETDTPTSALSPADYTYDPQGRVTSDTPGSGSSKTYSEDRSSDLTALPTGATASYYGSSTELTSSSLSGTATSYTYDASGNRTAESGGLTMSAGYNGANELTSYSNAAANMSSATYDGDGLRASTTTTPSGGSASTQNFAWSTVGSVPELLQDSTNAYIYGPYNIPFEQVNLATGTIQYLVADALGSIRGVVNSSGSLTATTSYDAWGNPETTGGLSSYTSFGFAGGYMDPTGLIYFINRFYDPKSGSFLNVDPDLMTTGMAYTYASDNPTDVTDPLGDDPPINRTTTQLSLYPEQSALVDAETTALVSAENNATDKGPLTPTQEAAIINRVDLSEPYVEGEGNAIVLKSGHYEVLATVRTPDIAQLLRAQFDPSTDDTSSPALNVKVNSNGSVTLSVSNAVLVSSLAIGARGLYTAGNLIVAGINGTLVEGTVASATDFAEIAEELGFLLLLG